MPKHSLNVAGHFASPSPLSCSRLPYKSWLYTRAGFQENDVHFSPVCSSVRNITVGEPVRDFGVLQESEVARAPSDFIIYFRWQEREPFPLCVTQRPCFHVYNLCCDRGRSLFFHPGATTSLPSIFCWDKQFESNWYSDHWRIPFFNSHFVAVFYLVVFGGLFWGLHGRGISL